MNQAEKRKWQWRNFYKLAVCEAAPSVSAYGLLIVIIFTLDYFGIPEDKSVTTGQEPCAIMGEEIIRMSECYDMMLNEL